MRTTNRPCYVCGRSDNPVVISEAPVEERFGVAVLPAQAYELAWCRTCGTLYVDCDVSDAYLANLYRSESIEWQKAFLEKGGVSEAIGGSRLPEFRAHWHEMTVLRPAARADTLLDLGCQTGEFGTVAMVDGVVPSGIELSADYAQRARSAWGGAGTVLSEPLSEQSFGGQKFQYVSAFETLEHMTDPRACLKVLRQLVSADGLLALSVPSTHYFCLKFKLLRALRAQPWLFAKLLGRRAGVYSSQILPHTHLFNFTPRSVELLLRQAGFTAEMVRTVGWTGRSRLLEMACNAIMAITGYRVAMSPSVLALARPA